MSRLKTKPFRPNLEHLDQRIVPAYTYHTWSGNGNDSVWSNTANWSSGGVPSNNNYQETIYISTAAGKAGPAFPSTTMNLWDLEYSTSVAWTIPTGYTINTAKFMHTGSGTLNLNGTSTIVCGDYGSSNVSSGFWSGSGNIEDDTPDTGGIVVESLTFNNKAFTIGGNADKITSTPFTVSGGAYLVVEGFSPGKNMYLKNGTSIQVNEGSVLSLEQNQSTTGNSGGILATGTDPHLSRIYVYGTMWRVPPIESMEDPEVGVLIRPKVVVDGPTAALIIGDGLCIRMTNSTGSESTQRIRVTDGAMVQLHDRSKLLLDSHDGTRNSGGGDTVYFGDSYLEVAAMSEAPTITQANMVDSYVRFADTETLNVTKYLELDGGAIYVHVGSWNNGCSKIAVGSGAYLTNTPELHVWIDFFTPSNPDYFTFLTGYYSGVMDSTAHHWGGYSMPTSYLINNSGSNYIWYIL